MKNKMMFVLKCILFISLVFIVVFAAIKWQKNKSLEIEKDGVVIQSFLKKYELSEKVAAEDVLTVGKGKQFRSIQQAVEKAENGDVIFVFSGRYEEAVHAAEKELYIIGENREDCILNYPNGNYYDPPLEMGSGLFANMTVFATEQDLVEDATHKAYAFHIDFDISKNAKLNVMDASFINETYQVVGIGLRDHFTLRFQNCLFECKGDWNAFYCHDDPTQDSKSTQQRLIVEKCRFINNGENASTILMQSQEVAGSQVTCRWQYNTVENKGGDALFGVTYWNPPVDQANGWQNMSFWRNDEASCENSLGALNES